MESMAIENLRERRYERQEKEKRKKIKLYTLGGMLVTSMTLATQIFCGDVIKPFNAGYVFTSNDVTIMNDNGDYHSKYYTVRDSNGMINNFTFDELEKIEPDVHDGYTYIPHEYLPEGSSLGIKRVEENPVKAVLNGSVLVSFIGEGALISYSLQNQKESNRRRR